MKESIDIEKASMNDMGRVAEIIRSSASWYEPFLAEKDYDQHYVDEKWAEDNFKKRNFFVGKKDDGKIVGTVTTQYFGKDTYLGYVYLDADETGKGFGKDLIKFAEKDSRKRGQDSMILIAHPKAHWAIKAYERYGFEKIAEKKFEVVSYNDGILKDYYEEGFHLYKYKLA